MRNLLGFCFFALVFSSCNINSNLMFTTPTEYEYDSLLDSLENEYTLGPNDILNFRMFTNKGVQLLELNRNQNNAARNLSFSLDYVIRQDSLVDLPSVGLVNLTGLTLPQAQDTLTNLYSEFYREPFLQLEVVNKKVIVFPGSGGDAQIVPLVNGNTTLVEALAISGGVNQRGRADKVKLIRRENDEYNVYLIDLSTIEGINDAYTIVKNNDIIYVEPAPQLASEALKEITPIVTIIGTFINTYFLYRNLSQ